MQNLIEQNQSTDQQDGDKVDFNKPFDDKISSIKISNKQMMIRKSMISHSAILHMLMNKQKQKGLKGGDIDADQLEIVKEEPENQQILEASNDKEMSPNKPKGVRFGAVQDLFEEQGQQSPEENQNSNYNSVNLKEHQIHVINDQYTEDNDDNQSDNQDAQEEADQISDLNGSIEVGVSRFNRLQSLSNRLKGNGSGGKEKEKEGRRQSQKSYQSGSSNKSNQSGQNSQGVQVIDDFESEEGGSQVAAFYKREKQGTINTARRSMTDRKMDQFSLRGNVQVIDALSEMDDQTDKNQNDLNSQSREGDKLRVRQQIIDDATSDDEMSVKFNQLQANKFIGKFNIEIPQNETETNDKDKQAGKDDKNRPQSTKKAQIPIQQVKKQLSTSQIMEQTNIKLQKTPTQDMPDEQKFNDSQIDKNTPFRSKSSEMNN